MFGIHNYLLFLAAGIMLNLTPGIDTMYIVSRSISQGKKAGLYSAAGISSGTVVHTLLAAFGLSYILAKSILAFNMIKTAGAIYLLYLGVKMIRSRHGALPDQLPEPMALHKIYVQGIVTNVTNPKVALFFLAFLPQFIDIRVHSPIPFILLGMTFVTTGFAWCVVISCFAAYATERLRSKPRVEIWLNRITGGVFVLLGLNLWREKMSY